MHYCKVLLIEAISHSGKLLSNRYTSHHVTSQYKYIDLKLYKYDIHNRCMLIMLAWDVHNTIE